ncbi:MAG: hypothetical protein QG597_1940, partial [Actinomycetota bacterium]|nr:hypothetical protein [Actinomycetota bacterium]
FKSPLGHQIAGCDPRVSHLHNRRCGMPAAPWWSGIGFPRTITQPNPTTGANSGAVAGARANEKASLILLAVSLSTPNPVG